MASAVPALDVPLSVLDLASYRLVAGAAGLGAAAGPRDRPVDAPV
ncbi:MAG TPA: hypothetical protein VFP06_03860 [Acidimicrobiales bacterium]|nr:hypothetical protein [Acidimicrobiales bacterium]